MTIEKTTFIDKLDVNFPRSTDLLKEGDDHVRLIKNVLKATFPNMNKAVNIMADTLNYLEMNLTNTVDLITFNNGFIAAVGKAVNMGTNRVTNVGQNKASDMSTIDGMDGVTFAGLKAMFRAMYPTDSSFCTGRNPGNPNTLPFFVGTTWVPIGAGKYLVSAGTASGLFDFSAAEGGSTTFNISLSNMPAHNHGITVAEGGGSAVGTTANGNHTHRAGWGARGAVWQNQTTGTNNTGDYGNNRTNATGAHTHTVNFDHNHSVATSSSTGSGANVSYQPTFQNLYWWKRTDTEDLWS